MRGSKNQGREEKGKKEGKTEGREKEDKTNKNAGCATAFFLTISSLFLPSFFPVLL
jgi:hypothetical protein